MIRLYEPSALQEGITLCLSDRASHHLLTVLRAKINDDIVLFNGEGGEYQATITQTNKKQVHVLVGQYHPENRESSLAIHLAQSIPRADKMDYIVQKAVELGVTSITPIIAERSQGRLSKEQEQKKLMRLQAIIISACEQCGRNQLPLISQAMTISEWLIHTAKDHGIRYILLANAQQKNYLPITKPHAVSLLVGPEGGFSPREIELIQSHDLLHLTLGKRILRTETASIAAMSVMQWLFGDLQ